MNEIRIKVSKIGKASFDNITISLSLRITSKLKGSLWVDDTPILEVIFVTSTENLTIATSDTQGPREYRQNRK